MNDRKLDGGAVPFHALAGAVLGCISGGVECIGLSLGGGTFMQPAAYLPITLFYAAVWVLWGAALGVVVTALSGFRRVRGPGWRAGWTTLQVLASVVLTVGVAVNVRYLPSFTAPKSLAFDAALGAALVALFFPLRALLRGRIERAGSGARLLGVPLALTVAAFAAMTVPMLTGGPRPSAPPADDGDVGPNVLVLTVDALRARQVPAYGYPRARTPHLDRFLRKGVQFRRMIASGSRTKESTASIFTGLHPSTHGMTFITSALRDDTPIIPEIVRERGYVTSVLTANTLVSPLFGFDRGVDLFYAERRSVLPNTLVGHLCEKLGYRVPGMGWAIGFLDLAQRLLPSGSPGTVFDGKDARDINRTLLDWIARAPDRSHWTYIHYMEPHAPYDPPAPFDVLHDSGARERKVKVPPRNAGLSFPYGSGPEPSGDDLRSMLALHDGEIASWDDAFGGLLRGLEELGVRDRTLILVTADHGEEFWEHRAYEHGQSLFEEQIHIPLAVQWPGETEGPRIDPGLVRHIDLFPTVLEVAGLPTRGLGLPGTSLVPRLRGEAGAPVELALSEVLHGGFELRALTTERHKLVQCREVGSEHTALFDLRDDPAEMRDLAEREPHLREALLSELQRVLTDASRGGGVTEAVELDPQTEETLRALGYID